MGPSEGPANNPKNQERRRRRRCSSRQPRTRACLLKGCQRRFRPQHALQRYCSPACRRAALAWSKWKAQQRYRAKESAKKKRKEQCQRRRDRIKSMKKLGLEAPAGAARVIVKKHLFHYSCDRPGCYEMFDCTRRSPLQRFCSKECRRALERVWERERRWKEIWGWII
jgi:hypothetical protein